MLSVSCTERIPDNVDRRLRRALESWLPNYLDRRRELGPAGAPAPTDGRAGVARGPRRTPRHAAPPRQGA